MRDLLVYVQVPFCPSKCHFCGWVTHIPVQDLRLRAQDSPRVAYLGAVKEQIRHFAPRLTADGYRPKVMYWGGGTASILEVSEFAELMDTLTAEFDLSGLVEATVESSPDTLTPEKLQAYRKAGFDRVSIGVQSFDDKRLAREGRAHRSDQARNAVWMAKEAGFEQINVDLMCGLPDETVEEFFESAKALVRLPVTHISLYPYAPAPGTVMYKQISRGQLQLDRKERLMAYALGQKVFTRAGFPEYAMSYFGRQPCRADLAYYRMEMDFIGFGAGAASLVNGESMVTHRNLAEYTAKPLEFAERVPAAQKAATFLVNQSLAMFEGVDADRWFERIGQPLDETLAQEPLAHFIEHLQESVGLIRDARGIRLPREAIARTFIDSLLVHAPGGE